MRLSRILGRFNIRVSPLTASRPRFRRRKTDTGENLPQPPENSSIKEGYVWKKTNIVPLNRSWKRRYFVLNEDRLCFVKEKDEESASTKFVRIFDVVSLILEDFGFRKKKFGLRLRVKNKDSYILSCSTEAERNAWITAVLTAKSVSLVSQE